MIEYIMSERGKLTQAEKARLAQIRYLNDQGIQISASDVDFMLDLLAEQALAGAELRQALRAAPRE